jgi:lipopolysaccharide biosynthesis glycosyltransferase
METAEHPSRRPPDARDVTIACVFDDAFVPHFATCATSIAASRGSESVHFILVAPPTLTSPMSAAVGDYVRELGLSLEVVTPPEELVRSLPESRVFSHLVWYRTLLPSLLAEHHKVLSLDADTLVLQSLAPLFEQDLGDKPLAAVAAPTRAGRWESYCRSIGFEPSHRYFNAGVMMLNLEAMRESGLPAQAITLGHEKGDVFTYAEQDALNYVARDNWALLHPKWNALSYLWVRPDEANVSYTELEVATARRSPAVVHFEGGQPIKPWYYRSSHPLRHLYRCYRAQTPWPLEQLENPSVVGAVLRRLPVRWQYTIAQYKSAIAARWARKESA